MKSIIRYAAPLLFIGAIYGTFFDSTSASARGRNNNHPTSGGGGAPGGGGGGGTMCPGGGGGGGTMCPGGGGGGGTMCPGGGGGGGGAGMVTCEECLEVFLFCLEEARAGNSDNIAGGQFKMCLDDELPPGCLTFDTTP